VLGKDMEFSRPARSGLTSRRLLCDPRTLQETQIATSSLSTTKPFSARSRSTAERDQQTTQEPPQGPQQAQGPVVIVGRANPRKPKPCRAVAGSGGCAAKPRWQYRRRSSGTARGECCAASRGPICYGRSRHQDKAGSPRARYSPEMPRLR
jgi:hypothetical protein